MAIIRIKNLRLRTIIGINEEERTKRQDVVINVQLEVDANAAIECDAIEYAYDYKGLTKAIIEHVESSGYFLLERLADSILQRIMADFRVLQARVEVDKPGALRFADSVSVEVSSMRER